MPTPLERQLRRAHLERQRITKRQVDAALLKTARQPRGLEISYTSLLVGAQRQVNREVRLATAELRPLFREDAPRDIVRASINSLRASSARLQLATGGQLRLGMGRHAGRSAQFSDEKYDTTVMRAIGIGNTSAFTQAETLESWVEENVALVTNINREQIAQLETLFLRSLRDGSRSTQVQADVRKILKSSEQRARLVARDQIGKLVGQLDRQKNVEGGIDSYAWRSVLDERARPTHVSRSGLIFRWDRPPADGHPGQPVQCRCTAEPNLAPLLGKEFAPKPRSASDFSRATPEARAENRRRVAAKRRRAERRRAA